MLAIPQIQLQINDIQMNYSIRAPQVNISQPKAELSIKRGESEVKIDSKMGQLTIDQSKAFAEAGLKPLSQINAEYVQKGRQAVLSSIAKKAQQGAMLMQGAGKGQRGAAIQQIAKQNDMVQPQKQIGIKFVPSAGSVTTDYIKGHFNIDIETTKPQIDAKINKPKIDLTYGDVTGTMTQRPSVEVHI